MKALCVTLSMVVFSFLSSMNAKEAPPTLPASVELAAKALAGKPETDQLELLTFWKQQPSLLSFCDKQLDALYIRSKELIEEYARSPNGDLSVRASCFEVLRRNSNFTVTLPPEDLKLTMPITGYELTHNLGLVEFRRQWTLYRIDADPNPQAKLDNLQALEPYNKLIFGLISPQKKSRSTKSESEPVEPTPSKETASSTPWSIIVVLIVTALGLLWLLLKRRP